jgi:hypothetical protein
MAGDAHDTIARLWQVQDDGDYTATTLLFAVDAVVVDPVYGTFEGREAIGAFMAKMTQAVVAINGVFELVDMAGGDDSAWAQWSFKSDRGTREGVGICRVRGSEITYYRDYMNAPAD